MGVLALPHSIYMCTVPVHKLGVSLGLVGLVLLWIYIQHWILSEKLVSSLALDPPATRLFSLVI